ncbi:family 43 glycosylhydrolase [Salinimonas sp. HHU 13199]|uniref:Family 43 glycosylhydrolase n=1 Tax=Salinimonas profundi TaxID=2729140 RepID=A0ABR8LI81_9ALTE|nr:RICIN domain-containing protein [Salinimonas profundi]MBD3584796.1 family 43 glycosylhydrolase [Salinimonas profundi]
MNTVSAYAIDNGVYTINSRATGKPIEVGAAELTDGANIIQWANTNHDTQRWLITEQNNGYYSVINLNSGKALEVFEWSEANGGNVVQYEYIGGESQLWAIENTSDGYVRFINQNSNKALDLVNGDSSNGTNVIQWDYTGSRNQQWQLTKLANVETTPWDPSTTNGAANHWPLSGSLVTHDPTIANENGTWWIFQTGPGIAGKSSSDGINWNDAPAIFPNGLSWWQNYVPDHDGSDVWAPDIKPYNGRTWMYYSISTFGSRTSVIGLTSASSIAAGDWRDDGVVINTVNSNNYNAIDPDLIKAEDGSPWLVLGSWNSGIKLTRINPMSMKPMGELYSIASQSGGSIEAPTIIYRQGYYYLFVSLGKCCEGVDSTYRIAYGRATDIRGPYLDKNGNDMMNGGGTILDAGNSRWIGPGGQDILNTDVMVRHAYDASDDGTPKLLISTLNWDSNGWPRF